MKAQFWEKRSVSHIKSPCHGSSWLGQLMSPGLCRSEQRVEFPQPWLAGWGRVDWGGKGRENQVLRGRGSKKQKRNNSSVTNKFYLFSPFFKKEKERERLEKEKELRED